MKGKPLGVVFDEELYMEWMRSQPNPSRPMKYILKLYQEYLKEVYEYKLQHGIIKEYICSKCEFLSLNSSFCQFCNL